VEYLQVNTVKAKIRVGDSNVKVSIKDDSSGRLGEYNTVPVVSLTDRSQQPPSVAGLFWLH
jgi:hypothetical protein